MLGLKFAYATNGATIIEVDYSTGERHRDQKLPIGSGVTESACRTLVGIRMNRSGQRWGVDGGKAILAFRALVKSGRFDTAWRELKRHIKNPLAANDNRWTDLMKQAA